VAVVGALDDVEPSDDEVVRLSEDSDELWAAELASTKVEVLDERYWALELAHPSVEEEGLEESAWDWKEEPDELAPRETVDDELAPRIIVETAGIVVAPRPQVQNHCVPIRLVIPAVAVTVWKMVYGPFFSSVRRGPAVTRRVRELHTMSPRILL
jgi:hypothetical protein